MLHQHWRHSASPGHIILLPFDATRAALAGGSNWPRLRPQKDTSSGWRAAEGEKMEMGEAAGAQCCWQL